MSRVGRYNSWNTPSLFAITRPKTGSIPVCQRTNLMRISPEITFCMIDHSLDLVCYYKAMKFQPTPPREKIFAFQKILKVIASSFLGAIGVWHLYQAYTLFSRAKSSHALEVLGSIFLALIFFGLATFLYRNRSNNTQRYDDIPGYGP